MTTPAVLISATELETLMKSEPVVLIDTRDADTFAAGRISGGRARLLEFGMPPMLTRRAVRKHRLQVPARKALR